MAAKKSQSKKQQGMSMDTWKWLYVAGAVVAGVAGAISFQNDILTWVLMVVGVLAGFFYFDVENFMEFGLVFLVFSFAKAALDTFLPPIGPYLTGFFSGVVAFLGPVALTLLVRLFIKRNF